MKCPTCSQLKGECLSCREARLKRVRKYDRAGNKEYKGFIYDRPWSGRWLRDKPREVRQ